MSSISLTILTLPIPMAASAPQSGSERALLTPISVALARLSPARTERRLAAVPIARYSFPSSSYFDRATVRPAATIDRCRLYYLEADTSPRMNVEVIHLQLR